MTMPDHLLTIAEYAALGEPDSGYTELVEGRLLTSLSPPRIHNNASLGLANEIAYPGSRRTDRVIRHGEYADAGIP